MWIILLGSVLVTNAVAFFVHKRIPRSEIYATIFFGLTAALITDIYASFEFKAWGYFDKKKAEFAALWIIFGLYPAFTVLIVNWFPFYSRWWRKLLYILGWSLLSTAFEALTLRVKIIWHENWNLWWSLLLFPFIYYMLILQIRFYRWMMRHDPLR